MGCRGYGIHVSAAETLLVVNVGSSTLKFALFPFDREGGALVRGAIGYSGEDGARVRVTDSSGLRSDVAIPITNRDSAAAALMRYLDDSALLASVRAAGHRLVHGGPLLRGPLCITPAVRMAIGKVIPLAPDHLPAELRAIDAVLSAAPEVAQVACFDTAFHSRLPAVAKLFGLPRSLSESGIVRYGFHGLSYEYILDSLRKRGELRARTIIAHLGSGASIAAILDGVSVDTTMGLTPSGGIVMGTRAGDIDPGVILYLMRTRGFTADDIDDAINRSGGVLGISGLTPDMRRLLEAAPTDVKAEEAVSVFCYRASKTIGAYCAALGGVDALVFSGGIGEGSPEIRARICDKLGFLGIRLDPSRNEVNASTISTQNADVRVDAVKTDEEMMIARHVRAALAADLTPLPTGACYD